MTDALRPDQPAGIDQPRLHVFLFQPGVALQQDFQPVSRCEHAQPMFDRQSAAANDGLAAKDVRIHRDAFEEIRFVHWLSFCSAVDGQLEKWGQGQPSREDMRKVCCPHFCLFRRSRKRLPTLFSVPRLGPSAESAALGYVVDSDGDQLTLSPYCGFGATRGRSCAASWIGDVHAVSRSRVFISSLWPSICHFITCFGVPLLFFGVSTMETLPNDRRTKPIRFLI